jgi:micrococcal nuclease
LRSYPAKISRVIDGDTFEALVDLGFGVFKSIKLRLYGVNCPEMTGANKDAGNLAKKRSLELIEGKNVTLLNCEAIDKYGRNLAKIKLPDNTDLGSLLISEGLAVEYYG